MALVVEGDALAANRRSAKHAKRTVCFNIIESLLKSLQIEFARKFLSTRIYWGYLGISESGKAFSQIGNVRGGVISVRILELIQGKRMCLRRANMGRRPTASLLLFLLINRRVKVNLQPNIERI